MSATPKYGTMHLVGIQSKQTYAKDIYVSDVAGGLLRWDAGAGASATSTEEWRAPEAVVLTDYVQITGTADTEKLQLTRNGIPTGDFLRYSAHLSTLNNRPIRK